MRLTKLLVKSMDVKSCETVVFLRMSMLKSPVTMRCFFSLTEMSSKVSNKVRNLEEEELGERYMDAMIRFLSE